MNDLGFKTTLVILAIFCIIGVGVTVKAVGNYLLSHPVIVITIQDSSSKTK